MKICLPENDPHFLVVKKQEDMKKMLLSQDEISTVFHEGLNLSPEISLCFEHFFSHNTKFQLNLSLSDGVQILSASCADNTPELLINPQSFFENLLPKGLGGIFSTWALKELKSSLQQVCLGRTQNGFSRICTAEMNAARSHFAPKWHRDANPLVQIKNFTGEATFYVPNNGVDQKSNINMPEVETEVLYQLPFQGISLHKGTSYYDLDDISYFKNLSPVHKAPNSSSRRILGIAVSR